MYDFLMKIFLNFRVILIFVNDLLDVKISDDLLDLLRLAARSGRQSNYSKAYV
jgi:hypothetical protein